MTECTTKQMKCETFSQIIDNQIKQCLRILNSKGEKYAPDDKLHNFRVAAELEHCTMEQALAGMMAKHTISIYDMIASGQYYEREEWNEKISDHINYLLILAAILRDDEVTGRSFCDYKASDTPCTAKCNKEVIS